MLLQMDRSSKPKYRNEMGKKILQKDFEALLYPPAHNGFSSLAVTLKIQQY